MSGGQRLDRFGRSFEERAGASPVIVCPIVTAEIVGIVGSAAGVAALLVALAQLRQGGEATRRAGISIEISTCYPTAGGQIGDPQLDIEVEHRRGAPASVTGFGITLARGRRPGRSDVDVVVMNPSFASTPVPAELRPGGAPPIFMIPYEALDEAEAARGFTRQQMWPWVRLDDGRKIYTKHLR